MYIHLHIVPWYMCLNILGFDSKGQAHQFTKKETGKFLALQLAFPVGHTLDRSLSPIPFVGILPQMALSHYEDLSCGQSREARDVIATTFATTAWRLRFSRGWRRFACEQI